MLLGVLGAHFGLGDLLGGTGEAACRGKRFLRLRGHSLLWVLPLLPHVQRSDSKKSHSDMLLPADDSSPSLLITVAELKGQSLWVGRLCVEDPQALHGMSALAIAFDRLHRLPTRCRFFLRAETLSSPLPYV